MNIKGQSKLILKRYPEIILTYILFAAGLVMIFLPELLIKAGIKLLADKINFKWIKPVAHLIDIPASITTIILEVILLFAVNYYIFYKASERNVSLKNILNGFKIISLLKFILVLLYSFAAFIICQIPTIILGSLYSIYSAVNQVTGFRVNTVIIVLYFIIVIVSFIYLSILFIKRFGLIVYIYLYRPNAPLRELLSLNKYIYTNNKQEIREMINSYIPMLLLSFLTLGIYLFYFFPCFQISLILFVKKHIV